jgi:hypothetical protein
MTPFQSHSNPDQIIATDGASATLCSCGLVPPPWEWDQNANFQPKRTDGWEFTCDSKGCTEPATLHVETEARFFVCAYHASQIPGGKITATFSKQSLGLTKANP